MRKIIALAATTSMFAFASPSFAQSAKGFGDTGQPILSVDRLMPLFSYENVKTSNGTPARSQTITGLSLVTHGSNQTFYNVPRFAFDYVVVSHLTIGGSAYVSFQMGNSTTNTNPQGVQTTTDNPKVTLWGLAPRVGYVIPLGDVVAFWPRGGFSYNALSTSSITVNNQVQPGTSASQLAIDLEPTFVFVPIEHVGITLAGAVDIPLTGSQDTPIGNTNATVHADLAEFHVGVHAGLLVYF
jgi:hypothetical protein